MFPDYGRRYGGAPEVNAGNVFPLGYGQQHSVSRAPHKRNRSFHTHMSGLSGLYVKLLMVFGALFLLYFAGIRQYL